MDCCDSHSLNANSTRREALRMLVQMPVSEGVREAMLKYEEMILQILCYWVQSLSSGGAGATEVLLEIMDFFQLAYITKEKARDSRMLRLLNNLRPVCTRTSFYLVAFNDLQPACVYLSAPIYSTDTIGSGRVQSLAESRCCHAQRCTAQRACGAGRA